MGQPLGCCPYKRRPCVNRRILFPRQKFSLRENFSRSVALQRNACLDAPASCKNWNTLHEFSNAAIMPRKNTRTIQMMTTTQHYTQQLATEIQQTPVEYLPILLRIVKSYRESVTLNTAEESFRQAWKETLSGDTYPINRLWDGIE